MILAAEEVEDFWFLLHNLAHWEFELFLMFVFDVILGLLLIPLFKRWLKAHDAKKHLHEHCEDVHQPKLSLEERLMSLEERLEFWLKTHEEWDN